MNRLLLVLLFCILIVSLWAQPAFKPHLETVTPGAPVVPRPIELNPEVLPGLPKATWTPFQSAFASFEPQTFVKPVAASELRITRDLKTRRPIFIEGIPDAVRNSGAARSSNAQALEYLQAVSPLLELDVATTTFEQLHRTVDELGMTHLRLQQYYEGIPVFGADVRLHGGRQGFDRLNGRTIPNIQLPTTQPSVDATNAVSIVREALEQKHRWNDLNATQLDWVGGKQVQHQLVVYPMESAAYLAWEVDVFPNLHQHYTYFVDALTGTILHSFSHRCDLVGHHLSADDELPNGPETATLPDLNNNTRTINVFEENGTYFAADFSREMFREVTPDSIAGLILTYDAMSQPELRNVSIAQSNNNSDWDPNIVSIHYNAGVAYEYFRQTFNRNAIDGRGGDIVSFANVPDEDGSSLENAFWNGRAMFYGNGGQAFLPFGGALDVAGHEMSHGVIQETANLIYENQPGALNESMADVFGYLIEGEFDDFRLAEEIVLPNAFPSGALRNLIDPNNGGSSPQDLNRGWQPAHMDEFLQLENTPEQDNGGVHINSGIPNRAFALFVTNPAVGVAKAEQVYYRALSQYLTRSSQFIDMRIAVIQAATDLHGANSPEVAAARAAFDAVGIGDGAPTDTQTDFPINPGDRLLLLADTAQTALFTSTEDGSLIANPLIIDGIASRPSIVDDGTVGAYIDNFGRITVIDLLSGSAGFLEENPQTIWRNIAVSKDGNRVALLTNNFDNEVRVVDLVSGQVQSFFLFNPTTAQGAEVTNDLLFADAIEWDASGEFLLFDALSRINTGGFGGAIEYWDIGVLRAWNPVGNQFGDGAIFKLFSNIPEGVSIGNATIAKNSPFIIAFDAIVDNQFQLLTANIETGETNLLFQNSRLGFPSFGVNDDRLAFDASDTNGGGVLAVMPLASDKISAAGSPGILFPGGHWGVFYGTGERDLSTSTNDPELIADGLEIFPNPTADQLTIRRPEAATGTLHLAITDATGRQVLNVQLANQPVYEVAVRSLPTGLYIVQVRDDQHLWTTRMMKQ